MGIEPNNEGSGSAQFGHCYNSGSVWLSSISFTVPVHNWVFGSVTAVTARSLVHRRNPTNVINKKASIRWQDSAPSISGYWPTREPKLNLSSFGQFQQ